MLGGLKVSAGMERSVLRAYMKEDGGCQSISSPFPGVLPSSPSMMKLVRSVVMSHERCLEDLLSNTVRFI